MRLKPDSDSVKLYLLGLQDTICESLAALEPGRSFDSDVWQREEGGGGTARVLANGSVFASAGVNFSHVSGDSLPPSASRTRPELAGRSFEAMGVSLVLHPVNPHVPTTHMNVRFFNASNGRDQDVWWFGGGFDLTPYYPVVEDCVHWHQTARQACDPFGDDTYVAFKQWCDDYFYLPHREEARGIGGIFFDDYNSDGFNHSFSLMQSVGDHFLPAYLPVVERRQNTPYSAREVEFQRYRRGRYVEFNLVYDRGTLFGLQSGGRTESILMSLPPEVSWRYNWEPEEGTPEALLYTDFLPARNWLTENVS